MRSTVSVFVSTLLVFGITLIGVFALTKLKSNAQKMHELASLDNLTKLPNRHSFNMLIDEYNKSDKILGLLFIDLDNFKHVNDTLGHHAGDIFLQEVAKRLTDSVRSKDVVFRLGGDEFTVLLPNLETQEQATKVAQRILDTLAQPFNIKNQIFTTEGSIGLALSHIHAKSNEELIKFADTAMYRAKENGKGCFIVYDTNMISKADRSLKSF